MKLCLAQIKPKIGDVSANIIKHKAFIERAVSLQASAIFFPELSLIGYEPKLAKKLACDTKDSRFDGFQEISDRENILIGMGLPINFDSQIFISMMIFQPGKQRVIYSKQELHSDELPFFAKGSEQLILNIGDKQISPAICYESLQPEHARKACQLRSNIYLASVAKSKSGVEKGLIYYPKIAKEYNMHVLMVNCIGKCDNIDSVGQSAAWTKSGICAGRLNDNEEGLLVYDTETEKVSQEHTRE